MKKGFLIFLILITSLFSCNTDKSKSVDALLKKKQYYEAINMLEKIDKKSAGNYFQLAEAYRGIRKLTVSDSLYELSMKMNPMLKNDVIKAYSAIASTDFMKGYTFNSIKYWQKILELNKSYDLGVGFYYIGQYMYENEKPDSAKPMLINALNISLTSKEKILTFRMLIDIFKNQGKLDSAMYYAKKASDEFRDPQGFDDDFKVPVGEMTFMIAKQNYEKKNYDEALNMINDYIKIGSPLSLMDDAYLLMGDIYFELNQDEKAITFYKKVMELNDVEVYGSRDTYERANEQLKAILKRSLQ